MRMMRLYGLRSRVCYQWCVVKKGDLTMLRVCLMVELMVELMVGSMLRVRVWLRVRQRRVLFLRLT